MSSLFADTHNVVAILEKSDAAEGFKQIIDFLSGSYIHYALTVSPPIYISCIKQFWNSVAVKRSGDVTRLQALLDKKKIVISEAVICEILQLNDSEGVVCLTNKEIFAGLAQMGYEKPSTKLTFYKAFFSSQWKFLIHTILQSLSAKSTSWNEFSTAMASAVICLSKGQRFNFSKYIFDSLERFLGVKTPLFESMLVVRDVAEEAEAQVPAQGDNVQEPVIEEVVPDVVPPTPTPPSPPSPVLATCSAIALRVKGLENDKAAQRLKKVGTSQRVKSSDAMENVFNQGRKIVDMDQDEGIELVLSMQEDDTEVQEAVEIVITAKLMTEVVTAAATQVATASIPIPAAKPKVLTITAAPVISTRRRKGVVIRDPEEDLPFDTPTETPKEEINKEHEESYKNINWNAALDHIQFKEPQHIKRYHGMKKKPQTESEVRKNMIFYLKNTKDYKMDFFKGKKYDEILPIFQAKFDANMRFLFKSRKEMEAEDEEIIKSINETPTQKAAKRRKLSEEAQEAEDLRKRLEIIVVIDNKPRYKIKRADDTHQLYISFTTLLKNFDREDLEALWKISVHGLALVKRLKLLTSCGVHVITLSIVQLFLLVERSKSKDCQSNIDAARLKLKLFKNITAAEEMSKYEDGNPARANVKQALGRGSYALSWKPCQGDSLNLPDHSLVPAKSNSYLKVQIKMIHNQGDVTK
nr:hypothetical protein [Tanacetum cinerariifolium]